MPLKGGGVGRPMANTILNFHFDYWNPSLTCELALNTKTCIRQHILNDRIDLETFSFDEFNMQFRCKGVKKFYS